MRKLASIQTVTAIRDIPGADKIVCADVLGWHVVVKRDEFKPGDSCVYVEIDSVLPERPEFEFMKDRHYRVKTVKLRGQISQGICFPLSILPGFNSETAMAVFPVDMDVTEMLGIQKYEPPELDSGPTLGNFGLGKSRILRPFPSWISKTDETRVQSVPWVITMLCGVRCYVTQKCDGSSITIYLKDGKFGVCSRTTEKADVETCHFWRGARNVDAEAKMRAWSAAHGNRDIALQGELVGPGIQKNMDAQTDHIVRFFNAFDPATGMYMDFEEFVRVVRDEMGLTTVPVLNDNFVMDENTTVDGLVAMATAKSTLNPKNWMEGIVVRPVKEMQNHKLGRVSFKVINPEYLLKSE